MAKYAYIRWQFKPSKSIFDSIDLPNASYTLILNVIVMNVSDTTIDMLVVLCFVVFIIGLSLSLSLWTHSDSLIFSVYTVWLVYVFRSLVCTPLFTTS